MKRNKGRLITLGSFDGVHRGHAALVERAVAEARRRKLKSTALTFALPPRMVLDRSHDIAILSDAKEKEALLKWKGLDDVIVRPFDRRFSQVKPYVFFRDLLLHQYRAKGLVIGLDFRFGASRSAGATELVRWGEEQRIPVWVIPPVRCQGTVASSTEIRRLFARGLFSKALQFLEHPYLIHGHVVKGRAVGRRIGFPTTNLKTAFGKVLPLGVFAVFGRRWGQSPGPLLTGVCNIGTRPTFLKSSPVTVEIHWLTGRPPVAPSGLMIELVDRLRGEKRFSSPTALGRAIANDIKRARQILNKTSKNVSILRSV